MKTVTLGKNLKERITGYLIHSCKTTPQRGYAEALAEFEGEAVEVTHEFHGAAGPVYAYTVKLPTGKLYHLPALFTEES